MKKSARPLAPSISSRGRTFASLLLPAVLGAYACGGGEEEDAPRMDEDGATGGSGAEASSGGSSNSGGSDGSSGSGGSNSAGGASGGLGGGGGADPDPDPDPVPRSVLPRTGQTKCSYFDTTWQEDASCSQTYSVGGLDYPFGQNAHYQDRHQPRSFSGPSTVSGKPDDYITTDNVTGLVWATCDIGRSGADCSTGSSTQLTFTEASDGAAGPCVTLNGSGYAGRTDWRLPTPFELYLLVNFDNWSFDPAFPNSMGSYWSGRAVPGDPTKAYKSRHQMGQYDVTQLNSVRCVSGSYASSSLEAGPDGTVEDELTRLSWTRCPLGQNFDAGNCSGTATSVTWLAALKACEELSYAGETTWRLPNATELLTTVEHSRIPAVDEVLFPGALEQMWTSTSNPKNLAAAFLIVYANGSTGPSSSKAGSKHARCVMDLEP